MNTVNVTYGMRNGNSARHPALIILSGLPGTGKTTFARALVEVLPAVHVESDAIRRGLAVRPSYTNNENARVFAKAEALARQGLKQSRHTVVDATNLTPRDRRRFVRLAHELDATLICVRVTAPEDTIRERLARPREGYSQATFATYEEMRGRARPFSTPAVVVDTRFELGPSVQLVAALATRD